MSCSFTVVGAPKPLKRHRHTKSGHTYDPSVQDKHVFLEAAQASVTPPLGEPLQGPLAIHLQFLMPRPKSHYRTGKFSAELRADAPVHHTNTPDCDNLIKLVLDALNGVFFGDDSQIGRIVAEKMYGPDTVGATRCSITHLGLPMISSDGHCQNSIT